MDRLLIEGVVKVHLARGNIGQLADIPGAAEAEIGLHALHAMPVNLPPGAHAGLRATPHHLAHEPRVASFDQARAPRAAALRISRQGRAMSGKSKHSMSSVSPSASRREWLIRISARVSQRGIDHEKASWRRRAAVRKHMRSFSASTIMNRLRLDHNSGTMVQGKGRRFAAGPVEKAMNGERRELI